MTIEVRSWMLLRRAALCKLRRGTAGGATGGVADGVKMSHAGLGGERSSRPVKNLRIRAYVANIGCVAGRCTGSLPVGYQARTGTLPVVYRLPTGRLPVEYRWTTGRLPVDI